MIYIITDGNIYIYIYIYIYMCVCVCVYVHIYIYIYIYIYILIHYYFWFLWLLVLYVARIQSTDKKLKLFRLLVFEYFGILLFHFVSIYVYIYIYVCVCARARMCVYVCEFKTWTGLFKLTTTSISLGTIWIQLFGLLLCVRHSKAN